MPERCQKVVRKLPDSCTESWQKVDRKLTESWQKVAKKLTESHETVMRQSWDSHETVMKQSWDSHETVMRQSWDSLLFFSSCRLFRHVCSCLFVRYWGRSPQIYTVRQCVTWKRTFWKHRPMLSISQNVCLSVCSLLRYRLNVFLPPLPKVRCPIFLEIQNPWGKVMERSGLIFEHFCLKVVKNCREKKGFFCWFCLTKNGGNHASRWIRDLWSKGVSLILAYP